MLKRLVLALWLALSAHCACASTKIVAQVDPRVELMSIVMRLAGAEEYNMPASKSPYSEEVDKCFSTFKTHEAIKAVKAIRFSTGVGYDAPMSLAVHLDDVRHLKLLINPTKPPTTFDSRWKPQQTEEFLVKLRAFVKDTKFEEFIGSHQAFYKKACGKMDALLARFAFAEWSDGFFGPRPNGQMSVAIGLLNGGGNYGVSASLPSGKLIVEPVIGAWQFDKEGVPVFTNRISGLLIHEFSHTYANRLVLEHLTKLKAAGEKMFKANADQFRSQAYSGGETVLCESMVRACTVRFIRETGSKGDATRALLNEINNGFWWTDGLADLFDEYMASRSKYKVLADFMPRVVEYFNGVPARLDSLKARMPKVVSFSLDATGSELVIAYDRPMKLANPYAVWSQGGQFKLTGPAKLSDDRKNLVVLVKLEPGTSYAVVCQAVVDDEGYRPAATPFKVTTRK